MAAGLSLGAWVRGRRRALRLTQTDLAHRAGVTQQYVSLLERGQQDRVPFSIPTLCALATALEVSAHALVEAGARVNAERLERFIAFQAPRRQNPTLHHELTGHVVSEVGESGASDWDHWMAEGRRLHLGYRFHLAPAAFDLAARKAAERGDSAREALALAEMAHSYKNLTNPQRTTSLLRRVHRLLGTSDSLLTSGASAHNIAASLKNPVAVEAFARTARVAGHVQLERGTFADAEAARGIFVTLEQIGLVTGERHTVAEGRHFQGRAMVEIATIVPDYAPAWRAVRDPELVRVAIAHFRRARELRDPADWLGRGGDLLHEANALALLGERRESAQALYAARQHFDHTPTMIHWFLFRARRALVGYVDPPRTVAVSDVHAAASLALSNAARMALSHGFLTLALLPAADPSLRGPRAGETLAYCAATMVSWPYGFEARDFARAARLFLALDDASTPDVRRFLVDGRDVLIDALIHLDAFEGLNDSWLEEINDHLRALKARA
jgi:transcriptional regulator with XRE-family HTH domain